MSRERLSTLAALPDAVTDPLLWRLAFDVAAAHLPGEHGHCRNLQASANLARALPHALPVARWPPRGLHG